MSKHLLPFNNLLLRNKNNNSGGKNSTAKTVSITYAMTSEEINKRKAYNAQVEAGLTTKSYDEFSKTYGSQKPQPVQKKTVKAPTYTASTFTPETVRNNLLQGKGSITDLIRAKKVASPEQIRNQLVTGSTNTTVVD